METALVWFRRDLRVDDNATLWHALNAARRVHCAFVFDTEILDALADKADRRVEFIHGSVPELARVPDKFIHAPWKLSAAQQTDWGVVIGRDYPPPLVDHARAREVTLALFKAAAGAAPG